jgi:uroporphyrinogen decarboxylase
MQTKPMSRRQRFEIALNHQEPDRIPIAFGGPECSINLSAHRRLLDYLGYYSVGAPVITDNILQLVEPDERLYDVFDVDVRWIVPHEAPVNWSPDREIYIDEFGRQFKAGGGFFNQVDYPLKEGTDAELARYRFPDMSAHNRMAGQVDRARHLYDAGYGLTGDGAWGIYEISSSLRGTENLFVDMALNPDYVTKLAERVYAEHIRPFYTMLLQAAGQWLQMVIISDDYGGQRSLLFSPDIFRSTYKPLLAELVTHIRTLTDAKIYLHSDGAVAPLIPDFIEIGIDGLNPVQYTAQGMQAGALKQKFGDFLGFFGGGIENEVLSFGSTDVIRQDVQQQINMLAPGGGYIFASIHNITPEVPPENIMAFFEAGKEFGKYPLRQMTRAKSRGSIS